MSFENKLKKRVTCGLNHTRDLLSAKNTLRLKGLSKLLNPLSVKYDLSGHSMIQASMYSFFFFFAFGIIEKYAKFNMVENYNKVSLSLHYVEGYPDIIQNDPNLPKKTYFEKNKKEKAYEF